MACRVLSFLAASLLLLGVLLPTNVVAAPPDKDGHVVPTAIHDRARAEGEVRVLVELLLPSGRVAEGAVPNQARALYRQEITDAASRLLSRLAQHQHRVVRRYVTAPLIALEAGPTTLQELDASSSLVKRVTEDRIHKPVLLDSVPLIGADKAWAQGFDGTGRVVALIDTGVDSAHQFLAGKVVEEACYSTTSAQRSSTLCPNGTDEQIGPGAGVYCPLELEGCWHGTHVAGIATGNGTPSRLPIWGVGRGASIMSVQVFSRFDGFFDCGGAPPCIGAYTSDILAALERVYALRTTHPFAAVNMSLGGGLFDSTCDDQPYKPFIDNLRAAGIATVVASGNNGAIDQLSAPACVSTAVSVGATTKDDQVAYFSNVAPFLSLFAPGVSITSSFAGGGFAIASGTSMAAPHVAGTWAVLKQAKPTASVDEILQALSGTGVMIEDTLAETGTTRPRIQVDLALSALLNPGVPIIAGVSPKRGTLGTSLTVTVNGINFQPGATASFGADITVTSMTVVSSTQLSVALAIAATENPGPRDVTVTNPGGQTATRVGGFTVLPLPPTLGLAFLGMLRDKVGRGNTAFSVDGALDGSFRVTVQAGRGARTVTRLELRTSGGVWDTDPATAHWALGAAGSLDGGLLNAGTGTVSFGVADGGTFFVFAADPTSVFTSGASFTLTANFADGTSATATSILPNVPTISSVSPSTGLQGANLTVTVTGTNFQAGASAAFGAGITVSSTTVVSSTQLSVALVIGATAAMGVRDVTVANPDGQSVVLTGGFAVTPPPPTLGLAFLGKLRDKVGQGNTAFSVDGALDGSFRVTVQAVSGARTVTRLELSRAGGGGVWDTDPATANWALGASAGLDGALLNSGTGTVSFGVADGGAFFVFAADPSSVFTSGVSFTLTANFADGASASASASVPFMPTISSVSPSTGLQGANLTVTVTGTNFQAGASAAFGAGIRVSSTTVGSSAQLSVALVIGATAAMGARDVTVTNPDGQTVVLAGGFTVAPPPPTLGLAFLGKLRDKVGQGNTAFSADSAFDGSFRVTVQAAGDARTVPRPPHRRGCGLRHADTATAHWALGAAGSLDGGLLNSGTGTVSFGVTDGGTFFVFAADPSSVFTSGASFTLTANFADGASASASASVPFMPTISS